eukprot:GILJ01012587.1.p1 GENE.GILJ01012587.1~~GILJ01012587.1.p1  ORF type:complete len:404 (+),score=22.70 GILJ01012587.1:1-1212(+)
MNTFKMARSVLDNLFTKQECKELIYIHQSCSVVGYRPHFTSTTFREIVAAGNWSALYPLVAARERVRDRLESEFGLELSLHIEFTGLTCWFGESHIPFHYDSNRSYLRQRHYSAIVYLNDQGVEFEGGSFLFANNATTDGCDTTHGYPLNIDVASDAERFNEEQVRTVEVDRSACTVIQPTTGRCVLFSSGPENLHGIDPVTKGERYTLILWFTQSDEQEFDEDVSLLPYIDPQNDEYHHFKPPAAVLRHVLETNGAKTLRESLLDYKVQRARLGPWLVQHNVVGSNHTMAPAQDDDLMQYESSALLKAHGVLTIMEVLDLAFYTLWQTGLSLQMDSSSVCLHKDDSDQTAGGSVPQRKETQGCQCDCSLARCITSWRKYRSNLTQVVCSKVASWNAAGLLTT